MEKTMEHQKKVIISKRAELAAKGGHPWIYGTEIEHADEGIEAGDIVRVESKKGEIRGKRFLQSALEDHRPHFFDECE